MRDEVLSFLKRAIDVGDVAIDLCSTGVDAGIVRTFEPGDLLEVELCTDHILDSAKSDASGRSGKVRFELQGIKDGKRWGRQALVIDVGGAASFGVEDANMAGIIIELTRDKRDIMRMCLAHTDSIMARQQTMMDMQSKQLIAIEEQRVKIFEVLEDLTQNRHARDIAAKEAETNAIAQRRLTEQFLPLLPAMANRLLGKSTGDSAAMAPEMVNGLIESLDEEQLQKIASALHPAQAAVFFEFVESMVKAKEERARTEKSASNGTNASGGIG